MCKLLNDFQVKVFQSCYRNHSQTAGIVGPSAEIISNLNSQEIYSVTLIGNGSRAVPNIPLDDPASRYKLQTFLVSISTETKLEKTLQDLKTSQWWNHMASFLIIDSPRPVHQGCSKASKILNTAWNMNLLHAKFICHEESKGTLIYSYNPYTDHVPHSWQLEKTYKKKNNHPWTLLVRSYQGSQVICKNLDFDQTKDLGGYEIRTSVQRRLINKNSSRTDLESVTGLNAFIVRYMLRALNSTSKVFAISSKNLYTMTTSSFTDMSLDPWYQQNDFNSSMTYPHRLSGMASITQHRGNLSQIDKILRVIDHSSRYAVVIVCFVTFAFFKFFLRQSVTTAGLTIIRLICNASVPNVPNNVATRIYLSGLFLFVVTMQAIYQGQLASLLTKPVALPDVETIEDLENFKYTIYGHRGFTLYFEKLNFSGRIVPLDDFNCVEYVLRDNSAACVNERCHLVNVANKYDIHLSDPVMPGFAVFLIRKDWPVEERLNTVISRLFEGHIIEYVYMKDTESVLMKQKIDEKEKENQTFTVIVLEDLGFAFAILGIGLAISTVVFVVEIWKERR